MMKLTNGAHLKIFLLGLCGCFGIPAFAQTNSNVCSNLQGDLYGLCNSYCIAKQCATSAPNGSKNSCDNLKDKFFQRAGFPVPCLANASISVIKKTNGVVEDPSTDYKLIVGSAVTWSYIITNTGNVAVTINSVVDSASQGANPTVSCQRALPASLAAGATLECSANGSALLGQYTNTVTVSASSGSGVTSAEANGSYLGVKPGITITSAPSSPSVVEGDSYNWNYVVTNTGTISLANITYSEPTLNCPSALAASETQTCASPTKTAGTPGTESDTITASASFTDNSNNVQQVSDTANASITISPDVVLSMINHTALAWPDGTPYSVIGSLNSCTLRFTGTVPQFPGQTITNNTYFVFINSSNPAQQVRIVDPVQGITCLQENTTTNTGLIIKDICPSNAFNANAPAVSVQQLMDWCVAHNGQTLNYHPQ